MKLFPLWIDIEDKTFLVIGGGRVGAGKVERLKQFTERIVVIAEESAIEGAVLKPFEDGDLERGDIVIAATDDPALNQHVSELCQKRGIPVNVVDCPELCTFIFPAFVKRGDLTVAVTTAGRSPAFSAWMRERVEEIVPENTEEILDAMAALRIELRERVPDQRERARILKERLAEYVCGN